MVSHLIKKSLLMGALLSLLLLSGCSVTCWKACGGTSYRGSYGETSEVPTRGNYNGINYIPDIYKPGDSIYE